MALYPPSEKVWWREPIAKVEIVWIVIAFNNDPPYPLDLGTLGLTGCTQYQPSTLVVALTIIGGSATLPLTVSPEICRTMRPPRFLHFSLFLMSAIQIPSNTPVPWTAPALAGAPDGAARSPLRQPICCIAPLATSASGEFGQASRKLLSAMQLLEPLASFQRRAARDSLHLPEGAPRSGEAAAAAFARQFR